jgi:hypothetical protein
VVSLYCAHLVGLPEVRLETFLIHFVRPHGEGILTEEIPDKTLAERMRRKRLPL